MKNLTLATLFVLGLASPALANHCPMDMKKIEAAMKTTMADDATKKRSWSSTIKVKLNMKRAITPLR